MPEPQPNAALAYKVLDHIDAHPEQHDQSDFVRRSGTAVSIAADAMPCGTTACFAGWAVLLSGHALELNHIVPMVKLPARLVHVDDMAAELLGIGRSGMNDDPPHALFYEARTRADLGRLVAEIFGPHPRPWTSDEKLPGGGTRIHVKRACNGCGELLGDVTDLEMSRALAGLPAEDVRTECPRCRTDGAS